MAKVTFLGLGVMGYPMARHIAKAGHDVTVYNRTTTKAEKWVKEFGGKFAKTPKEASKDSDFVFCCVGNDNDLKEVTLGSEGAFHSVKKGAVFIDNTTASAKIARELFIAAKEKGFGFLDAPVSGGQAGAENGQLTVMIGGEDKDFEKAQDIIKCYSKKMKVLGPAGSRFGQNAGLNMEDVIEVISKGAAQSWQMENRYKTMIQGKFDFGFAVDWMRKDLGIAMDEAKNNGSDLPITKIIDGYYSEVQKNSGNRFDTSSLITRLKKNK
jgi:3-hydroxyisobutyrate dehydrogenase